MTTEPPFDFDGAIRTAKNQIANETVAHEKRMEFWKGYASAMEEVRATIRNRRETTQTS